MGIDLDMIRRRLQSERDRLVQELADLDADLAKALDSYSDEGPYDQHMAEMATATLDREIDLTLQGNARATLARIRRALEKLEEGTYGLCDKCGEPIPEERLEAVPFATLCLRCKRLEERTR
ncbi:MAG: TraR/DksA C4-type zinc finger protein [Thermoleophilia bacterium]|nr:TraR/DksA C4-type zinc finger protein [Thermoleophilia bacterium]